jgi:hypothetical protein
MKDFTSDGVGREITAHSVIRKNAENLDTIIPLLAL